MNNFIKTILFILTVAPVFSIKAQDYPTSLKEISGDGPFSVKPLNWRLYAGPEMIFLLNGDASTMKGGRLGLSAGIELNKSLTKKSYFLTGLNFNSGGYERWENDVNTPTNYVIEKLTTLELPLGIGFNLGKHVPKGFFTNLMLIPSYSLFSRSESVLGTGLLEVHQNKDFAIANRLNFGGKLEFGIKTLVEKNNYASFSISAKSMFINRFSQNSGQYTTLNIAALMGYYF